MATIKPLNYQGELFYPVTIVEAIVEATSGKTLKQLLEEIESDLTVTVDSALSSSSTNPVQNKVINTALGNKADKSSTVTNVAYDSANAKLTKTINGSTTDLVSVSTLKTAMQLVKGDVGLGNVTNDSQVKRSEMGVANGVATLDSGGKVPSSQLPAYVDDVIEGYYYNSKFYKESTHTTEITGEGGKIYTDLSTNKTYRWGGTAYAEISPSIALGETSGTAYEGSKGKQLADTIALTSSEDTTLEWNTLKKIATANGFDIKVQLPVNPNTDTSVTAVGNHYTPAADDSAELTATLSGTAGAYALNTEYTVITGIKAQRDAKGHIVGITYTAQKVKDTNNTYTVGSKNLKVSSNSGTATTAINVNESSADRTLQIKGDGTHISGAVSGSANAAVITLSHSGPATGSDLTTSDGTPGSYALNTEYTVLTGVTVTADAKGHITGVKTTRQKVKDTNTSYSTIDQSEASTGTATTGKLITAKVLTDTINEKAVTVGTLSNTQYSDITNIIIPQN